MDGWMHGRIERMDGWTDGQMDRWAGIWMDRRTDGWADGQMGGWTDGGVKIPARQASSEVTAAVDVELSKRCFQVTRTVKFAKMAKKFRFAAAKTPGLRVTPPRMPKLQRAKLGRSGVHFRIRPLFLRTDFLKFKKKIPIDTFSRIRATKWRPLAARHGAMVLAGCPSAPGHPRASTLSTDGPRSSKCKFKKKTGGHRFLAAKKTKKLKN